MSIFLAEPRDTGTIRSLPAAAPRGLGEEIAAGYEAARRVVNLNKTEVLEREETERRIVEIEAATGQRLANPYKERFAEVDEDAIRRRFRLDGLSPSEAYAAIVIQRRRSFEAQIEALKEKFPDAGVIGREEADAAIRARAQDFEIQLSEAGLGGFVGAVGAGFTDPVNIATAPIGGSAKTVLGAAMKTAGANMAIEAAVTPFDQVQRRQLGLETGVGQAALNIALAGAFGLTLGAGVKGGEIAFGKMTRRQVVAAADALPAEQQTPEIVAARNALEKEILADECAGLVDHPDPEIAGAHREALAAADEAAGDGQPPQTVEAPGIARETLPDNAGVYLEFDPDQLVVDAERFQFKAGGDVEGVTDALRGVEKWDPIKAGAAIVWEANDGRFFVADGHQRTGLARRLKAQGQSPKLRADVLREADGFSAADVRAIAAAKNIAQGTGTAIDAAKVLKVRPELLDGTINPRSGLVRNAQGLMRLGDDAFGMIVNEVVPDHYGAIVGRLVDDPAEQVAVMGVLARQSPANVTEAEALIRQAASAGFVREVQTGLFGDLASAESMLAYRAAVLSDAVSQLRRDKRIFATLTDEADAIEAAGNRLAADRNEELARNAAEISQIVLKTAHLTGRVSDALKRAAEAVAAGGRRSVAVRQFIGELRDIGPEALRGLDAGGRQARGAGRGVAPQSQGGRSQGAATDLDNFDNPADGVAAQRDGLTAELLGDDIEPDPATRAAGDAGEGEASPATSNDLDPDEMLLTGEALGDDGVEPRMQSRADLEAEFRADEQMLDRLEGCVRR